MTVIPGFADHAATLAGQRIAWSQAGDGPPVLLLHGFPQTRAMWRGIAPGLARDFTVIAPDLRGYGASGKPVGVAAHAFREMAGDQLRLMAHLGYARFHVIGHDRGARVGHRLALDAPEAVRSLTLMDIAPTLAVLERLSTPLATAYYHWFFLAQPAPLPERMIAADPDAFFERCLAGWGDGLEAFDAEALALYRRAWRDPETIAGMCNDYRAALEFDARHDAADRAQRVDCPALVLYGADGVMARSFDMAEVWADRLTRFRVEAMPGGHFFPDLHPQPTLAALRDFLSA